MKNKELTLALTAASGLCLEDCRRFMETLVEIMGDHFAKGDCVLLSGLGTFEVRKKMERIIVNPVTAQRMLVPPKLVLAFKPYLAVKASMGARTATPVTADTGIPTSSPMKK